MHRQWAMTCAMALVAVLSGTVAGQAHLDYTIDCSSFTPKIKSGNSCDAYGSSEAWGKIIDRPLPEWYADMKLGIFIHWGVFSVPSYGTEWFWHNYACGNSAVKSFADKNFPSVGNNYPAYADMWKAELYDPDFWIDTFKGAGAQYVLPVAKHHDGFCLWNASETSPMWNAVEVGPKRDVLTELYNSSLEKGLPFGIYYSQGEWFDANFVADARSNYSTSTFVRAKLLAQRLDLVHRFSKAMLWHTDGGWMAPDQYWNNLDWLTYVDNESPLAAHVVTCNSMGVGCCAHHGSGEQAKKCWEYGDAPSGGDRTTAGMVTSHFYTNQMTLQRGSWSWDRSEASLDTFFSSAELLWTLISTTAWNGTLVMNIGPTADGRIPPIFLDRLAAVGSWLKINGEAIYGTRPWTGSLPSGYEGGSEPTFAGSANSTFYTVGGKNSCQFTLQGCESSAIDAVFAIFMTYPQPAADGSRTLILKLPVTKSSTTASLLTSDGSVALRWNVPANGTTGISLNLPELPDGPGSAWVIKFTGLNN